jgi:hypothetical protein
MPPATGATLKKNIFHRVEYTGSWMDTYEPIVLSPTKL